MRTRLTRIVIIFLASAFNYLVYHYFTDEIIYIRDISNLMLFVQYMSKGLELYPDINDYQREILSYSIDDMLLGCRFNNKKCTKDDFEHIFTFTYGNCYKFNSGKNFYGNESVPLKYISSPGKKNGLRLELFIGHSRQDIDILRTTGAHIFIHNSSILPLTDLEGISLAPGFETDVIINQVNFNKQSYPYSNCIENVTSMDSYDSFLFKSTVNFTKKYRQKYCFQLCYQRYLQESCNCFDVALPYFELNATRPCNDFESLMCGYGIYANFTTSSVATECFSECPLECNSISYNLFTSEAIYPSQFYSDFIINNQNNTKIHNKGFTNINKIKQSSLVVNIYYSDLSFTSVNEIPSKPLKQFIADLGGSLGLCMGCSILSLIEIIELFIEFFFIWCYHKQV